MEYKVSAHLWEFACLCMIISYIFATSYVSASEGERRALLQLRDSLNYPNGSSLVNEWVGDDYCSWDGVLCNPNTAEDFRVLDIFLVSKREKGLGIWFPNASLVTHFQNLESLDLSGNNFGGWITPQALCGLRNLRRLDLGYNPLSGDIVPHFQTCTVSSLEELTLSSMSPIGSPSTSVLTALCGLKNLRSLDLSNNMINDTNAPLCLPSSLHSLDTLDLSGNHLQSSPRFLTGLCSLMKLKKLSLRENFLDDHSIPSCLFYNQSLLESLDISLNNLKGSSNVLSDICKLQRMQTLKLNENYLQGGIDPCISKLTSLVSLDLSFNSFVGKIPPFMFSNLTSLDTLLISDNKLEGSLYFASLANLSNLRSIDFSNNYFLVITESPRWTPSFQLMSLNLRNCGLNKYHGEMVPSFISSQEKIEVISLSYNGLKGTIPSWLMYNSSLMTLSLRANSFNGEFPLLPMPLSSGLASSALIMLDVSDNHLSGQIPSTINFPELTYINMSFNAFKGEIPSSYGNLTQLEVLDLSKNLLQGQIPLPLRHNHTSLAQLVLSMNDFSGERMPSFSNMSNLAYLHLQNVGFSGSITNLLSDLPILKVLDLSQNSLSGNLPNSFDTFPNLSIIILSKNKFHGAIPNSLCHMQMLHVLDISANSISGLIPSCLSNITSLKKEQALVLTSFMWASPTYVNYRVKVTFNTKGNSQHYEGTPLSFVTAIDLSVNRLTGEIPSPLGELGALRALNLSNNTLTGSIPRSFANLARLESLDLSHNSLEGSIPPEMVQLHFLSTFNVSCNNLKGSIPFDNNFRTFEESSYRDNAGLCGPPLQTPCGPHQQRDDEEQEEGGETGIAENDFFFFSCIAALYVVGFWGVILPLILCKRWRAKYYAVVDSCIYMCHSQFCGLWTGCRNY